jgi:hypothetical protein
MGDRGDAAGLKHAQSGWFSSQGARAIVFLVLHPTAGVKKPGSSRV